MNRLAGETSPYLLQHKDNPVHWYAWGEAAFAQARQSGKPILLSVGYAACHWCHVMAHESFEDESIAALMNARFVNIKVDREERPDVDALYQNALALMGTQGGWPLTMFLTPTGEPFWGGTYFPPESRYGRPGFPEVLLGIAETYAKAPDKVQDNVHRLRRALENMASQEPGSGFAPTLIERAASELLSQVDTTHGGLMGAPKFPQAATFDFLWRAWKRSGNPAYRAAVTHTLDRMAKGGIYDHLGGGFARYATDAMWLVPHFEKMLYDNALLVDLMTLVWPETRSRLLSRRIDETVGWMLREMRGPSGAFTASLDADSEGHEGRFYTWTAAEIDAVLGVEAPAFKAAYAVDAEGNWEDGRNILHRLEAKDEDEARFDIARLRLLSARDRRVRPGRDDKVLADWNGMAIAAIAQAGWVFDRADWISEAIDSYKAVVRDLAIEDRLVHSWCAGKPGAPGLIDDYAQMARAALVLHELSGAESFLDHAKAWVAAADRHHWDVVDGGYFHSADSTTDLLLRSKPLFDSATPSANAVMTQVLAKLFHVTGQESYRERATAALAAQSGAAERMFPALVSAMIGQELLADPWHIIVAGEPHAADTYALVQEVLGASLPNRIFAQVGPGAQLPRHHPAFGKGLVDGKATAYLCRNATCSAPLTDAKALREALGAR